MYKVVLGLGISGIAAAEFLLRQKAKVIGLDANLFQLEQNPQIRSLIRDGMRLQHDKDLLDWSQVEQLIVSPGISSEHPIYQMAKERGIDLIGEAELALTHFQKPLVAVTGTNGKTTVVLLVEHILNTAGIPVKALGNVGHSLCDFLLNPGKEEGFVVELSSFQLETCRTPVFDTAVLLNITPDHLDRYSSMQAYAQAKCHLQTLIKKRACFFVQKQTAVQYKEQLIQKDYQTFGVEREADLSCDQGEVIYREKVEFLLPFRYRNGARHDLENVLAAWVLCQPFSISNEQFCHALETFEKPPHRIEFVREIEGVLFYDDSKGTNLDAVIQAVQAMKGPVILIAGGKDKGASYLLWKEAFLGKIKQIIAIGEAAPKIERELHPYFDIKRADSLSEAVTAAATEAKRGDHVLLSPGCSSYDMFRDYAHRGEEFQHYVQLLEGRRGS